MFKIYKYISFRGPLPPSGLRPEPIWGLKVAPKPPVWKFFDFKKFPVYSPELL